MIKLVLNKLLYHCSPIELIFTFTFYPSKTLKVYRIPHHIHCCYDSNSKAIKRLHYLVITNGRCRKIDKKAIYSTLAWMMKASKRKMLPYEETCIDIKRIHLKTKTHKSRESIHLNNDSQCRSLFKWLQWANDNVQKL